MCTTVGCSHAKFAKKTFLYNSIKIMLDKRLLKDSEGFNKYNQLSLSHKVELLSLKSPDEKVGWAEKSVENKWSVRELRKSVKPPLMRSGRFCQWCSRK